MEKVVLTKKKDKAYRIYKTGNTYIVSIDKGGIWNYNWSKIAETKNLEDAYAIIRSHSGSEIREIIDK